MTKRFYEKQDITEHKSYQDRPELHGIIHQSNYDYVSQVSLGTMDLLGGTWEENIKRNVRLWKKHRPLNSCIGLARNKATIGVGAGPSFKNNCDVLKRIMDEDGVKDWEDRNFYIIASNHQYKPLLNMGIIPDFVILVDAADTVYTQLCEDIPSEGQGTTLITGLHCSSKILDTWSRQGREILFYASTAPALCNVFQREVKKNPHHHKLELGGNTLNAAWMISIVKFQSTVFMALGNDLAFPSHDDLGKRRKEFYSDGDYSTMAKKTGSGRDEAAIDKVWAGFHLKPKKIWMPNNSRIEQLKYDVELEIVGTSGQLWVYKIWLESTLLGQLANPVSFRYYNCSESGILGVMARKLGEENLKKQENWFMFDEVCRFYHTTTLEDAGRQFASMKEIMKCQGAAIPDVAKYATGMAGKADIVKHMNLN